MPGSGILAIPMSDAEHDSVSKHWIRVCSVARDLVGRGIRTMWVPFEYVYGAERAQFWLDQSKATNQSAVQNTLMRIRVPGEPDLHPTCNLRPKSF